MDYLEIQNVTTPAFFEETSQDKDRTVLTSAIIVSVFTFIATVFSIVRSGAFNRCRNIFFFQKIWKNERHIQTNRNRNGSTNVEETIALNSLRGVDLPSLNLSSSSSNNNNNNSNNSDNNSDNNNSGNIRDRGDNYSTCSNSQTSRRDEVRETRLLLEIEVSDQSLREGGQTLIGCGNQIGPDDHDGSLQANPTHIQTRTQSSSSISAYRGRRVRFQSSTENSGSSINVNDQAADHNSPTVRQINQLQPSVVSLQPRSSENTLSARCSQMAASIPQFPTQLQGIFDEASNSMASLQTLPPRPSQEQLHAPLALHIISSTESPSATTEGAEEFSPQIQTNTFITSFEELANSIVQPTVGVAEPIRASLSAICPTCSTYRSCVTTNSPDMIRGGSPMRQPRELPENLLLMPLANYSPPPYDYSITPPPSYSSLFPN